ncbi:MAG: YibE/F family protein [Candidatus Parcubacteria bacterium]|nr:YibE/F family protein [Candidatus Parcubacteria bacterium]
MRSRLFNYLTIAICILGIFSSVIPAYAADLMQDQITTVRAKVVDIKAKVSESLPGFDSDVQSPQQTLTVTILEGDNAGKTVTFDNDYVQLKKSDVFFLTLTTPAQGEGRAPYYAVEDPDRLPILGIFAALFILLVIIVGGKQGVRGLVTLLGSFVLILYALVPGILHGYSPILIAIGVSSLIIVLGSYVTHGFNKTTSFAVAGMIATVIVTGILAYIAIHAGRFTGYGTEEAVYLNMNARGHIDMLGLLLGGIMIGLLGVLYDVAISQAITVEELHHIAPHIEKATIFKRSIRIGREHIGALVNTLAIAYVGASLPLLLLFSQGNGSFMLTINREIFSAEIIRILIGSIGLVLAVPITTALATMVLVKVRKVDDSKKKEEYVALEHYSHHH